MTAIIALKKPLLDADGLNLEISKLDFARLKHKYVVAPAKPDTTSFV